MWILLMGDDIDSVKSKNLESSLELADKLSKSDVAEGIVPKLKDTVTKNKILSGRDTKRNYIIFRY